MTSFYPNFNVAVKPIKRFAGAAESNATFNDNHIVVTRQYPRKL